MEITEVKVFPVSEEKLKAFVSIVFDRCFMINDIKIIQGRDGLFVSMPSRKKKNGEFKDVAHPLNNDTRRVIEAEVVAEYERVLAERGQELPAPARSIPADGDKDGEAAQLEASGKAVIGTPAPPEDGEHEEGREETEQPKAAAAAESGGDAESTKDKEDKEKSLEEVQEAHLRDSFWSMS